VKILARLNRRNFGRGDVEQLSVAVVGAGPAGSLQRQLANHGEGDPNRDVNRQLAEYGIYYDKYKMKEGRVSNSAVMEMLSLIIMEMSR
jgi:hypothetical protein